LQVRGQLMRWASPPEAWSRIGQGAGSRGDFVEHAHFSVSGHVGEKLQSLTNGEIEHFVNILALITDFEHLRLVACTLALVADQFDVGENCISTVTVPSPWQVSQRPPGTLKEKCPAGKTRLVASAGPQRVRG